jgi:hypothetical protein
MASPAQNAPSPFQFNNGSGQTINVVKQFANGSCAMNSIEKEHSFKQSLGTTNQVVQDE